MRRDLRRLADETFDIVVVGGGIYGACIAWEAVLRGLKVALLERADFGGGTSSQNQRVVHGGFRYLQNADLKRVRESVRERRMFLRVAPHLVRPLPFLLPTYRTGIQHKAVLGPALALYDVIAADRNHGIHDRSRRLPRGRIVSREECFRLAPGIDRRAVTGGAVWYDGEFQNPDRLTLAFVRSSVERGACVANYVGVRGFLRQGDAVVGVSAEDELSGDVLEVRARQVVSAAGPWTSQLLARLDEGRPRTRLVKSLNILTRKLPHRGHGLSVIVPHSQSANGTHDGCCVRYFFVPWRGSVIAGSLDSIHDGTPDECVVSDDELTKVVDRINAAYPGADLTPDDADRVHVGLLPLSSRGPQDDPYNAARHYQIVDHAEREGVDGLVSVVGVKYTTARDVAEKALDVVQRRMGQSPSESRSATTPLHGGDIRDFEDLLEQLYRERPRDLPEEVLRSLANNHGSAYTEVLGCLESPELREPIWEDVVAGQVSFAVREEMAQRLSDVVFRRTELAARRHPGEKALQACARIMAVELGWSETRVDRELTDTKAELARLRASPRA